MNKWCQIQISDSATTTNNVRKSIEITCEEKYVFDKKK